MPYAPDLSGCALEGRYELHAVIGEGAFGRVYSGRDRRLERPVAVKLIKPWWAEDPEWVRSFEREAQLLARVSDPGIVQIFDVGHAAEGLYYVSELVQGESLAVALRRGPLPAWEAAAIAEQLCRALGRAHAQSVVHRDVKPANILISADGQVKVGDFGVARLAEGSTDGASATIVGTPRYMAPEQARGGRITPATDVYSVGIVLYEMIAGRPPFTERSAVELALRHLNERPAALPQGTPKPVEQIVQRALAKNPSKRHRDGGEIADDLAKALRKAPVRAPSGVTRGARPRQRSHIPGQRPRLVPAATTGRGAVGEAPPRPPGRPRARPTAAGGPIKPPSTRLAPKLSPRRNVNPSGRRRAAAALTLAFALLAAMIAGALAIGSTGHVRVPRLAGLRKPAVKAKARRLSLQPKFTTRYASARRGTVIAQRPRPGRRVVDGSTIAVVLSGGPPPVRVPQVAGDSSGDAQAELAHAGLRFRTHVIVAPGVPAGTVTSQSPAPGAKLPRGSRVALDVAEVPQWKALASFSGGDQQRTIRFRVRGPRWRVVYSMGYHGDCTFLVFCSGPSAEVTNAGNGSALSGFDLNDGSRETHVFQSGAGVYRLTISPGSDSTRWSMWVEDYY
ncbi:MAG TPA: protein kinase [Solirubrobacteraceae bacterium]|jgi:serine/threonine-protein kinase